MYWNVLSRISAEPDVTLNNLLSLVLRTIGVRMKQAPVKILRFLLECIFFYAITFVKYQCEKSFFLLNADLHRKVADSRRIAAELATSYAYNYSFY